MMISIRHLRIACLGLGAVLALAACRSAPIHFYTLVPSSAGAPIPAAAPASYRVAVLPVGIPAQVDQPQLVVRQGQGSVALLENRQWIAPLGDEIRTVLSDALVRKLGTQDVYGLADGGAGPLYRVKVDVRRFESVPGSHTLLTAGWSVYGGNGKEKTLQCTSLLRESVGPGYAALVEGHQRALQALAGHIAAAVRGMAAGGTVSCPSPE